MGTTSMVTSLTYLLLHTNFHIQKGCSFEAAPLLANVIYQSRLVRRRVGNFFCKHTANVLAE